MHKCLAFLARFLIGIGLAGLGYQFIINWWGMIFWMLSINVDCFQNNAQLLVGIPVSLLSEVFY